MFPLKKQTSNELVAVGTRPAPTTATCSQPQLKFQVYVSTLLLPCWERVMSQTLGFRTRKVQIE